MVTQNVSSSLLLQRHPHPVNQMGKRNREKSFATIPYVKGVSERVKKILNKANVTTAFKPVRTLGTVFKINLKIDRYSWPAKALSIKLIANHAILRILTNQNAPGIHAGLNTSQGRAAVMTHS